MKYDLHLHSCYSKDGFDKPKTFFKLAKKKGFSGFAITDHDSVAALNKLKEQSRRYKDITIIRGQEISSKDGHILAYGIENVIPKKLSFSETIEKIHHEGGIAIAAHPFDKFRDGVGDKVINSKIDGLETINGHTVIGNSKAKKIAKDYHFSTTAGSDAHLAQNIGRCYIECDGESEDEVISNILTKEVKVFGKGKLTSMLSESIKKRTKKLFSKN